VPVLEGRRILVLGDTTFFGAIQHFLSQRNTVRCSCPPTLFSLARDLAWADLVWVEWAGKWASYVGRLQPPGKVVCRLHGSNVYKPENLRRINWARMDHVFVVSEHLKGSLLKNLGRLDIAHPPSLSVLYNGIDLDQFTFRDRRPGFKIGVIASVRFEKGYPMLVDIARELVNADASFKIHIIGYSDCWDCLDTFEHNIRKWGLHDHIVYGGLLPHEQVGQWLADKDIILSASLHEGHPVSLCEAMACGIKPVVYEYPGAREVFPDNCLFDSIDDAVRIIRSEDYSSASYRALVADRFSIERQISEIDSVLGPLLEQPRVRSRRGCATRVFKAACYRAVSRLKHVWDN